jgi:hypothetical protein
MLLCATFALGVYIGRHGWGQQNLTLQLPGDRSPPPDDHAGGPPDVIGQIRSLSQKGMQLATQQGPRWIQMDPEIVVESARGEPLALGELRLGDLVAVYGEHHREGQLLTSTRIIVLPKPHHNPP